MVRRGLAFVPQGHNVFPQSHRSKQNLAHFRPAYSTGASSAKSTEILPDLRRSVEAAPARCPAASSRCSALGTGSTTSRSRPCRPMSRRLGSGAGDRAKCDARAQGGKRDARYRDRHRRAERSGHAQDHRPGDHPQICGRAVFEGDAETLAASQPGNGFDMTAMDEALRQKMSEEVRALLRWAAAARGRPLPEPVRRRAGGLADDLGAMVRRFGGADGRAGAPHARRFGRQCGGNGFRREICVRTAILRQR